MVMRRLVKVHGMQLDCQLNGCVAKGRNVATLGQSQHINMSSPSI